MHKYYHTCTSVMRKTSTPTSTPTLVLRAEPDSTHARTSCQQLPAPPIPSVEVDDPLLRRLPQVADRRLRWHRQWCRRRLRRMRRRRRRWWRRQWCRMLCLPVLGRVVPGLLPPAEASYAPVRRAAKGYPLMGYGGRHMECWAPGECWLPWCQDTA